MDVTAWGAPLRRWRMYNTQGMLLLDTPTVDADATMLIELPATLPEGLYWLELERGDGRKEMLRWVLRRG